MFNLFLYSFLYIASFFATTTNHAAASSDRCVRVENVSITINHLFTPSQNATPTAILADTEVLEDDDDDNDNEHDAAPFAMQSLVFLIAITQYLVPNLHFSPNDATQFAERQALVARINYSPLAQLALGAGLQTFRI